MDCGCGAQWNFFYKFVGAGGAFVFRSERAGDQRAFFAISE
jgi:hypothetical protein